MGKKRIIQFRVTQKQYERIMLKKENAGYYNLSNFVREFLLRDDLATEKLIRDIHKKVVLETKSKEDVKDEDKTGV